MQETWTGRRWQRPTACARIDTATAPVHKVSAARCLLVVMAVGGIVGLGQLAALAIQQATPVWTNVAPHTIAMASPMLAGLYQVAFLTLVIGWFTTDRRSALGLTWPTLRLRYWVGVIVALYALKAGASLLALGLSGAPAGLPDSSGTARVPIEGLAPFVAAMNSGGWPLLLAGGVVAAMLEEVLYRGFLSRTLEDSRLGFWGGALLAALVWAALHVYYPYALQGVLVVMGLALSWLRQRTGSVYPGMAWHIANNVIGLIAMRLIA